MSVNTPTYTPPEKTVTPEKNQLSQSREITHPQVSAALNKALMKYKRAYKTEDKNFQYNHLCDADRFMDEVVQLAENEGVAIPQHVIEATMDGRAIEPPRSEPENVQTPENTNIISFENEKVGTDLLKLIEDQRKRMQEQLISLGVLERVTRENIEQVRMAA